MRKYPNYTRTLPEPSCVPYENYKTVFELTLPIDGPGSSYEAERLSLPLQGFGSMLCLDYLALAKKKAAKFIADGGWKVSADMSDIRGVKMIVFRDEAEVKTLNAESETGTQ